MFTDIFTNVVQNVWPMIFIFTIIIVSVRLVYLFCNKKKFVLYKELLMLAFIIYILLLYYIVTFQDNNYGTDNFVPFREIFRYKVTSPLFIKNVLGNILLFVPFGMFISNFIKSKSFLPTIFITLATSCSIEFAQSMIGRTADVDDVILNVTGGVIGYLLYKLIEKISNKFPKFIKSQIFLDLITIMLILMVIYLAFRFNFWRIFE